MMGHAVSTYNDIKNNTEKLRELYASSGLSIISGSIKLHIISEDESCLGKGTISSYNKSTIKFQSSY